MSYHKYMRVVAKVQRLATICLNLTLQKGHIMTNKKKEHQKIHDDGQYQIR